MVPTLTPQFPVGGHLGTGPSAAALPVPASEPCLCLLLPFLPMGSDLILSPPSPQSPLCSFSAVLVLETLLAALHAQLFLGAPRSLWGEVGPPQKVLTLNIYALFYLSGLS